MEYDIIIRGFASKNQLFELLSLLSKDERERILNCEWQDLWDDYWIDHTSRGYTTLESQSKRKFPEIKELLGKINESVECKILERPLVFPKGKAVRGEDELESALREAREETKDPFKTGELYFKSPILQHYIGSDGKKYIATYYVWKRSEIYSCNLQHIDSEKLRVGTISHELETDCWIEIPIFKDKRDQWEWENSLDSYAEFGMYRRHFETILNIHSHIT